MSKRYVCPYINFHGRAGEALELYKSVLGGTVTEEEGPAPQWRFEADGITLIAVDGHPKYPPSVGNNMAIALFGSDREAMTRAFEGLAEGGKVKGPLTKRSETSEVGYLDDRFGINWIVTIER